MTLNSGFYLKLAVQNLKKNKETYVPYIISCIGTIFIYFMLLSFTHNPGLNGIPESESLKQLFSIGKGVVTIFAVIFIFYTNSFLMKRRKKEIGLYGILGLEKRHVARVMFYESLIIAVSTIGLSILFGAVFGKFLFLALVRAVNFTKGSTFIITTEAVIPTLSLFLILFALTFVWNYIQVKVSNPINLLKSGNAGEREPKARAILVLIGILGIAFGYYEALIVKNVFEAIMIFFVAVISVVIGTYATFTSGSIAILKRLKKNKRYYYKPEHFISVSNLIYRMKKNAVGLGNICILSTMVLIVVSTTVSLFLGKEDMLHQRFTHDIEVTWNNGEMADQLAEETIRKEAEKYDVSIVRTYDVSSVTADIFRSKENGFIVLKDDKGLSQSDIMDGYARMEFIDLDSYNKMEGKKETLKDNEILLFYLDGYYDETDITILGRDFKVKEELNTLDYAGEKSGKQIMNSFTIVVKDQKVMKDIADRYVKEGEDSVYNGRMERHYAADISGTDVNRRKFADSVIDGLRAQEPMPLVSSMDQQKDDWNTRFGGLLFLGGFLGILFLCALVMIVYFKQVSEGYEDSERFQVLKKVGMDKRDIRGTIYTQIRIVFLVPLITALIHEAVAFKIIQKLLIMFDLYNTKLILTCTISVSVVFVILYLIIYLLTARVYDRIVENHKN